jgi:REP element-mobilizing transposase RayT
MVHHVWAHAVDGRDLFADLDDRYDIVARLAAIVPDEGARCFGWTLMSNHLHLVVKAGDGRLGTLLQRVLTGYAMRFNGRAGRRGHLFQGRFGSRPVRDETDLHNVIRYVLRNPLEAGLARDVTSLERYPWGGLGALLGRRDAWAFESVAETLALFAPDVGTARSRLLGLLERPTASACERASVLDGMIRRVCAELAVAETDLRSGRRTRAASRARAIVCRRAVREAGLGVVEVARALRLSHAAVSQAARRSSPTSDGKGTSPS